MSDSFNLEGSQMDFINALPPFSKNYKNTKFTKYEKQKEKEYYLTHPSWYLFKNTVTGELISIALTGDEKEEFLELIPALVKIEKRGPGLNPHEWPGYFNVKKIRTPHDD